MADVATTQKQFLSDKVGYFTESVIREMTRQALLYGAVNLSQGFPDFPAPAEIKLAAQEAIAATSINTPSPGERRTCATLSRANAFSARESKSIRKLKLQFVAVRPKP